MYPLTAADQRQSLCLNPRPRLSALLPPLPLVLADRLDCVSDRGAVETGDVSLAGVSAAGDFGGRWTWTRLAACDRRLAPGTGRRTRDAFARSFVVSSLGRADCAAGGRGGAAMGLRGPIGLAGWAGRRSGGGGVAVAADPVARGRRQASMAAAALSLAAQFVVVMTLILPPLAEMYSARDLAEHFNRTGRVPPRLLVAEERSARWCFISTRAPRRTDGGPGSVPSHRSADAAAAWRRGGRQGAESIEGRSSGSTSTTAPISRRAISLVPSGETASGNDRASRVRAKICAHSSPHTPCGGGGTRRVPPTSYGPLSPPARLPTIEPDGEPSHVQQEGRGETTGHRAGADVAGKVGPGDDPLAADQHRQQREQHAGLADKARSGRRQARRRWPCGPRGSSACRFGR